MASAAPPPAAGFSEPTRLISQVNLQRLLSQLDRHVSLEWDDWAKIVALWFVDPVKRKKTQELIRWARAGRIKFDNESDPDEPEYKLAVDPWDSDCGPEDPVFCVPGLPDHLKALVLDQIGEDIDELRRAGLGLDVQGYRGSMFHTPPLDAQDLDPAAFIRGAMPGKPMAVTGDPGEGKTDFLMNYLASAFLRAGWIVVCNVRVKDAPKGYVYVKTFAQALAAAAGARLAGNRVALVRDEGGANRSRQAATSRDAINQKQASLQVYRKLDICEVFVIQMRSDLPREVASMATHSFHKKSRKVVECSTPTLRGIVAGIQTTEELRAAGRPFLEYDTRDYSPFKPDADIVAIIEHEYGRREASWEAHTAAIKERLDRIDKGPLVRDPLTLEQLRRISLRNHLEDTRTSPRFFFRFFQQDWLVNGIANQKVLWELMKNEWKVWSHPETLGKACGYCMDHHPALRLDAARESASNPPTSPDDV